MQLKDLDSIEKKISKVERAAKTGDAKAKKELVTLQQFRAHILEGKSARSLNVSDEDKKAVEDLHLLTIKPVIYVSNVDEKSLPHGNEYVEKLKDAVKDENAMVVVVSASI